MHRHVFTTIKSHDFQLRNEIIPGTSEPHHVHQIGIMSHTAAGLNFKITDRMAQT